MSSLMELVRARTNLSVAEVEHVHRLLESWQLIADLSFADLLLWCPLDPDEGFVCVAQMRPYTAQTLHPEDAFAKVVRPEELPVLERAYLEGRTWRRDEPLLIDGVPVRMEAVPVRCGERTIGVMTKEGAPLVHRRRGALEQNYLELSSALSQMVEEGTFPFGGEGLDPELSPRVGDGLIRLDDEGRVTYASPNAVSACRRLGILHNVVGEHVGRLGIEVSPAEVALELGIPADGDAASGDVIVLQRAIPLVVGPSRRVTGVMLLVRDVTELRHRERQLQRKEATIREIHHRVKNNLQTIASLLRIQARRLGSEEAKVELEEAVRRINSIAVVHEMLTRESGESVDFEKVVQELVRQVRGLVLPDRPVAISVSGDPGRLPADLATPLAVVVVELLQNAVQHAFDSKGGSVRIDLGRDESDLHLVVSDDGRGLPEGFTLERGGLGLQIVRELIEEELGGSIRLASEGGTRVSLDLPVRRGGQLR